MKIRMSCIVMRVCLHGSHFCTISRHHTSICNMCLGDPHNPLHCGRRNCWGSCTQTIYLPIHLQSKCFYSWNEEKPERFHISVHFSDLDSVNIRLKLKTWWMKYNLNKVAKRFTVHVTEFNETAVEKKLKWTTIYDKCNTMIVLQLTASPRTTEASTSERWQFGALTNRKATTSNRAPSLFTLLLLGCTIIKG